MADKSDLYKTRILKSLIFENELSGTEISTRTGKSLPLTTRILGELLDAGLITEQGYAPSTGGRRPLVYAVAPKKLYAISVAMDQLITSIGLVDLHKFEVKAVKRFNLPLNNHPEALATLMELINSYVNSTGVDRSRVLGVGIGMPGFVDAGKGINYSYLENNGKSITAALEESIGLPVYIDNDSSLIALAEFKLGAAREKKNAMVINISWGIGLGMIIDGALFRGYNGFAGEFSHMPLFNNNKLCDCGKSGCLETVASMQVLVENARKGLAEGRVSSIAALPENIEEALKAVIVAAGRGDQFAVELFSEAAYNIGKGLAILIHIVNPELIILSGRGASAGKIWLASIQQALNRYCIPRLSEYTSLMISSLNNNAELVGAAALVVENLDKLKMQREWLVMGKVTI